METIEYRAAAAGHDDVRGYAVGALGDPDGVLILDDTGDLKKGDLTVGTQRQSSGTAGRVENAQVAVYLAYATPRGSTLIDREVYLPQAWTDDQARCVAAGVPEHVRFATKITLGRRMLARALDAGVPAAWATADEFYGGRRRCGKPPPQRPRRGGTGHRRAQAGVAGLYDTDRLKGATSGFALWWAHYVGVCRWMKPLVVSYVASVNAISAAIAGG